MNVIENSAGAKGFHCHLHFNRRQGKRLRRCSEFRERENNNNNTIEGSDEYRWRGKTREEREDGKRNDT